MNTINTRTFSHEFIRQVNTFYDRSLYYSLSVARVWGNSLPNPVRWKWKYLKFFFGGGGVSLLRVIFRVFVKQAHIRVSFDFRINGHLRSSLFWDVTQRKLVATDISENLLVPPWRILIWCDMYTGYRKQAQARDLCSSGILRSTDW